MQNGVQIGIHGGKMADFSEKYDVRFADEPECKISVAKDIDPKILKKIVLKF